MEIKNELPQFEDEKSLIIVAWWHKGKFYIANNKNIDLCDMYEMKKPEYTDINEWNYVKTSGSYFRSWSVNESNKQNDQKIFLNALSEKTDSIFEKEKFKHLYLFAPKYMLNWIETALIKFQQNIKMKIYWNLVNQHPFKILEKITK